MPRSSTLASLSERLAQKIQEDRQQIEALTQGELRLHAESLKRLSAAALSTTQSATEQQHQALAASLNALQKQIEQQRQALVKAATGQRQALETEMAGQTKRLLWLMRWPVLGMFSVCLLISLGTLSYWKLASPYTIKVMGDGRTYQIMKGDGWTLCNLGTQKQPISRPCRQDK